MKKLIFILIFGVVFSCSVSAQGLSQEEFLQEQAQMAGADALAEALPREGQEYLKEKGVNPSENNWISSFSIGSVFADLWNTVKARAKAPFTCGGLLLAIVLISGALRSAENSSASMAATFAVTAATASVIAMPLLRVINSAVGVMQSVAFFMTAFIPVFAAVILISGQTATSVSMSGLLLGAAQVVEVVANHLVVPLMCGYLSVNVASGVSPLLSKSALPEALKKLSFWIMALITTVFLGVLSIQTTISASGDSLSMRTARFIIGSSVPIAGTVLSEALTTVTASLGVLKASVAIYGVVACCVIFLPFLLELLVWRLVLNLTALASEVLSAESTAKLLRSADVCISVLCGIILLTGALFVISLTVVVSVGRRA